ncbi:MAG: radical SAM protein [Paraclostridium sordellii]
MIYTILVTSDCNLRCSYCYEGEKKNKQNMTIETADKVIDFIKKTFPKSESKKPHVVFHGGEPFLNFKIIKYIKTKLDNEMSNNDIIYEITTNGTIINDEIIKFLKENNIQLSISIDGSRDAHNKYRIFSNGKGSYDIVIKNTKYLLANNLDLRCRMTYNSDNFRDLFTGICELKNIGLDLFATSANFYDKSWTKNSIAELREEIGKLMKLHKENDIHISIVDKSQICKKQGDCFGGITSFAITPEGTIYPCIFNINSKKFAIGTVYNFNYNEIKNKMYSFHREVISLDSECNDCGVKELCKGSKCKLLNYMVNKSYGTPPSITCELMKIELDTYKKYTNK